MVAQGHALFIRDGCDGCHGGRGTVRAPSLDGLFGSPVPLSDGTTVIADDAYIRDSILQPGKQIVASFAPIMPSFAGVIGEDDLVKLVAYVESLAAQAAGRKPAMSQAVADAGLLQREMKSYLADGFSLRSWLLTTDHKRIAVLYMVSITIFFFIGGIGGSADALQPYRAARACCHRPRPITDCSPCMA